MKQQVSLPGFAVPSHAPAAPAEGETPGNAVLPQGLSHGLAANNAETTPGNDANIPPQGPTDTTVADTAVADEGNSTAVDQADPQESSAVTGYMPVDDADAQASALPAEPAPDATPMPMPGSAPSIVDADTMSEADSAPPCETAVPAAPAALSVEHTEETEDIPSAFSASSAPDAPASGPAAAAPVAAAAQPASPAAHGMSEQDDWPPMSEMLQSFFVFEPTTAAPSPITVMGLDCARPRGLAGLAEAQRLLAEKADVICAGRMLLEEFSGRSLDADSPVNDPANDPANALAEDVADCHPAAAPLADNPADGLAKGPALKARLLPLTTPLEPLLTRLSQLRAAGERVLVLADGDPLLFGIGATLVRRLGPDAICLLPAVSSLQQACARLSLPWHKVICLSLHGRDDLRPLNVACGKNAPLCILTDARMSPDVLARHLLDRGVDWFETHIFERMGAADECVHHLSLADAAGQEFGPACTMMLVPMAPARRPHLGLDADQLAVDRGLITKKPVRAAALALLRIEAGHVVWDLGSGSGAVALEASVLAHEGRVIAVERSAGRAMGIQENRRRYGAANVEVRLGQAPECLPGLPDPQRVFIGGGLSGDDGDDILGHVYLRLPVGGRVVVSCVLLDSFSLCRRFFEDMGWPVEILQIAAAEGRSLGGDVHLAGMNPVFLLAAQKPAPAPIQSGAQPEGR